MWSQVRVFGFAGDRVDKLQAGAGIGELGRVELFQQMSDCAVGPRVRHWMDMDSQYLLLHIRQQIGLGANRSRSRLRASSVRASDSRTMEAIAVSAR